MGKVTGIEAVVEADLRARLDAWMLAAASLFIYIGIDDPDDAADVLTWVAYDPHDHGHTWQCGTDALHAFERYVALGAAIGWRDDPVEFTGILGLRDPARSLP